MSDFSKFSWPVGRKDHRCGWCGQKIPKGEKHFHFTGIWEGEWQNWRMHEECKDVSDYADIDTDGFYPYENERPVLKEEKR